MTPDFRVLLVDDEEQERDKLRFQLADHPEVKIVGEASSVATAAILCNDLRPNLVFLDVDMPGGNGFTLLEKLDYCPAIVFVTGFDQYAIRAFDVNAFDYLLKPVNPVRLSESLQRVLCGERPVEVGKLTKNDQVSLNGDGSRRFVRVRQISGIKAFKNYNEVFLSDGTKVCIRDTMTNWKFRLPKDLFFCHRSMIVNLQAVHCVVMEERNPMTFRLEGHDEVLSLGRDSAADLRRALKAVSEL
jgi:two-component system LytT family response regulator